MLGNYLISLIRTFVPVAVGAALTWLATHFGIVLDSHTSAQVTIAAVGLVVAAYYAAARAIERRWPALGRLLTSLAITRAQPTYTADENAVNRPRRW
jgi:hypothetical protein